MAAGPGRAGLGFPRSLRAGPRRPSITEESTGVCGEAAVGNWREEGMREGRREGIFVSDIRAEVLSTEELCGGGLAVDGNGCSRLSLTSDLRTGGAPFPIKPFWWNSRKTKKT